MDYSMPGFPILHYLPEFAQMITKIINLYYPSIKMLTLKKLPNKNIKLKSKKLVLRVHVYL